MTALAAAALWHKALLMELEDSSHSGSEGAKGLAARRRAQSLVQIFFSLIEEMSLDRLIEVGAHNGETSRRFVNSNANAVAHAYEPSPSVYDQVMQEVLPSRIKYINKAVGTSEGPVTFFSPNNSHFSVWGSTSRREGFIDVTERHLLQVAVAGLLTDASPDCCLARAQTVRAHALHSFHSHAAHPGVKPLRFDLLRLSGNDHRREV